MINALGNIGAYISNFNYIENKLCKNRFNPEVHCNGTCVLAKMLEESTPDKNPFKEDVVIEASQIIPGFLGDEFALTPMQESIQSKEISYLPSFYRLMLVDGPEDPPEWL